MSEARGEFLAPRRSQSARYVSFTERDHRSVITPRLLALTQEVKWGPHLDRRPHWKGVPLVKDPWDIAIYQMLIWELRPSSIIEFGSAFGGSAIWMTDIARAYDLDTQTVSYDNKPVSLEPEQHPGVTFLRGDCTRLAATIDCTFLATLPHPLLIVEDAHTNVDAVLEYVHPLTRSGDYLVVEDTVDAAKHDVLGRFIARHATEYLVDTRYTDQFGYNATWNWNGFLVRQ